MQPSDEEREFIPQHLNGVQRVTNLNGERCRSPSVNRSSATSVTSAKNCAKCIKALWTTACCPESGEVRGVMAQMEALLELLEGKGSRKAKEVKS